MPVLLLLFLLNSHHNLSTERLCLIISLVFSCLGDILLMQRRNHLFVFGLASFLIAHISYVISFIVRFRHEGEAFKRRLTISALIKTMIPFLAYIALMLYILCPKLHVDREETKGLLMPVVFYTFVIVSMAYISYLRDRKTPGFWSVFIGAVFFVLSDTLIAFNRFVMPIPVAGLFVMFTYGLGQYLITIGTLQTNTKYWKIR
ncbi:hypothetical protein I4U23_030972 [Adineta vaga]|nr:hypothetical protein I4U23_030972 [Adineta vaga]